MPVTAERPETPIAIHTDLRAIFVSLELSRKTWLIASLSPRAGEKVSIHAVEAGDIAGLLALLNSVTAMGGDRDLDAQAPRAHWAISVCCQPRVRRQLASGDNCPLAGC